MVFVHEGEAGDRFDQHLDCHSRRLAFRGVPDGTGKRQIASELWRFLADWLVSHKRQPDVH